ncbi:MAG TPA: hypothetical protein VKP14_09725 [Gaiellaceae bacterium]|nr:hypothetical protein [Gaiellaceae bacterium]
MTKTKDKVSDITINVKPYVERALHDAELRQNLRSAYESVRSLYDELIGQRGVTGVATRVAKDKDVQEELRNAISELRSAAGRVQGKAERKSRSGLLFVVAAAAALFNPITGPQTRKWISDRLFGGDDDFTYRRGNGSGSEN